MERESLLPDVWIAAHPEHFLTHRREVCSVHLAVGAGERGGEHQCSVGLGVAGEAFAVEGDFGRIQLCEVEPQIGVGGQAVIAAVDLGDRDGDTLARACIEAGSDGLAVINTVMGMAIDVERRRPIIGNVQGGLSGPAIRPIALLKVYQVYAEARRKNVPIIGQGGIETAHDGSPGSAHPDRLSLPWRFA